uniref:Polyketide synthase n=1 Tax=Peronospora matthiolae TaxID=2874970 RepID=A0AAV1VM78_9STRA
MPAASVNAMRARGHHKKGLAFHQFGSLPGMQMVSNPDKIAEHGSTTCRRSRTHNEVVFAVWALCWARNA